MAHVQKHTKAVTGHMCAHYDRSANNIGNENINPEKTKDNYNLAPERDISQLEFINQRCSEIKCLQRKDVNVMCSWVVTAPKDLPARDELTFFKAAYDFLNKRYGEKNVVSAYVHTDEKQPHMHYAFVPVVVDKKKGIEKLSAKELVNRADLQTFHKDLESHMTMIFGREIGILNEATKEGNKSIDELKRKSAADRLQEANQEANKIIASGKKIIMDNVNKSHEDLKETEQKCTKMLSNAQSKVNGLLSQQKALEKQIKAYNAVLGTFMEIEAIGKNSLVPGRVTMTEEDAKKLKEQAKGYYAERSRAEKAINEAERVSGLADRVYPLQNEIQALKRQIKGKEGEVEAVLNVIRSDPRLTELYNHQIEVINAQREQAEQKRKQEQQQQKKGRGGMSMGFDR